MKIHPVKNLIAFIPSAKRHGDEVDGGHSWFQRKAEAAKGHFSSFRQRGKTPAGRPPISISNCPKLGPCDFGPRRFARETNEALDRVRSGNRDFVPCLSANRIRAEVRAIPVVIASDEGLRPSLSPPAIPGHRTSGAQTGSDADRSRRPYEPPLRDAVAIGNNLPDPGSNKETSPVTSRSEASSINWTFDDESCECRISYSISDYSQEKNARRYSSASGRMFLEDGLKRYSDLSMISSQYSLTAEY